MRVIVTRPEAEGRSWVAALLQRGMDARALPLIDILPMPDQADIHTAWEHIADYRALMFVSVSAVTHFFAGRPAGLPNAIALAGLRIWAPGPGTAAAVVRQGVEAALVDMPAADSPQFDSEALWRAVGPTVQPRDRVLIVRGTQEEGAGDDSGKRGVGREWMTRQLETAGATVHYLAAYRRGAPTLPQEQAQLARSAAVDGSLWLFSSTQAVVNLGMALPGQGWSDARALATHPRIAGAATGAGFGVVWQSRPAISEVIASIESIR